jgi:putative transposase
MPWRETAPMKERMRFVTDWERGLYAMVELCERYGVSRKTGYKWVDRYAREGPDGLREQSRAPHHCPHRIAADVAAAICAGRRQHPSWGPDKILHWLKRQQPELGAAGHEHGRRPLGPPRVGQEAAPPTALHSPRGRAPDDGTPE